jgi:hypothetical protein
MNTKEWKFKDGQETLTLKEENKHLKEQNHELKKEALRFEDLYLDDWGSSLFSKIERHFRLEKDALKNIVILFAYYDDSDPNVNDAFVLFLKDSKLFVVDAFYDSTVELEDQWQPEETTIEVVRRCFVRLYGERLEIVLKELENYEK